MGRYQASAELDEELITESDVWKQAVADPKVFITACIVKQAVQTLKMLLLLSYKSKKKGTWTDMRGWNHQIFWNCSFKYYFNSSSKSLLIFCWLTWIVFSFNLDSSWKARSQVDWVIDDSTGCSSTGASNISAKQKKKWHGPAKRFPPSRHFRQDFLNFMLLSRG